MISDGPEDLQESRLRSTVRRRNREVLSERWIEAALSSASAGVLATLADGQPYVNPNLFVFAEDERAIYLHTAREGRTQLNAESSPNVAFTIFELGRLVPDREARDFTAEYASVVVFGRLSIVDDPEAKRRVLQRWFTKYFPGLVADRDYHDFTDADLARTTVYRLAIEEWSAKRNRQPEQIAGARRLPTDLLLSLAEDADQRRS
jgi:nitroimidazol reductase NimA-like FMN-containing flavoprotein (pyridoxamine 5'-phosphate oxidase superfamily)